MQADDGGLDTGTLDTENNIPNSWKVLKTRRGFQNCPPGNQML